MWQGLINTQVDKRRIANINLELWITRLDYERKWSYLWSCDATKTSCKNTQTYNILVLKLVGEGWVSNLTIEYQYIRSITTQSQPASLKYSCHSNFIDSRYIIFLDTFSHEFQLSNKTTKQSALEKGIFKVLHQCADYTLLFPVSYYRRKHFGAGLPFLQENVLL